MRQDLAMMKREASTVAAFRGHTLRWAAPWHGEFRSVQSAECIKCGAGVSITTRPLPNEVNIGGEALAVTCPGTGSKPCA